MLVFLRWTFFPLHFYTAKFFRWRKMTDRAGGLTHWSSCSYHDLYPLSALWIIEWSDICHPIKKKKKKRLLFLDKPMACAIHHFVTHDWNMESLTSGRENSLKDDMCIIYSWSCFNVYKKISHISVQTYVWIREKPGKFIDSRSLAKLSSIDSWAGSKSFEVTPLAN